MKKKGRYIYFLLLLLLLDTKVCAVSLPEELYKAGGKEAAVFAEENNGIQGLLQGISGLWKDALKGIRGSVRGALRSMLLLLTVVLCCGVLEGAYCAVDAKRIPNYTQIAGALTITWITMGDFSSFMGMGAEVMEQISEFSRMLLPTLASASAAAGSITAAGAKQVGTVFFLDLLITAVNRLLLPLLHVYIGTLAAGAMLQGKNLNGLAALMKKIMIWILSGILLLFSGYTAVTGILAGSADAASVKALKVTISAMLPVVGGVVSDASETVLVGAQMLRNTAGVYGMIVVTGICLLPFLKVGVQYLLYKCAAFLAGTASTGPVVQLMEGFAGAFGVLLGMMGSSALLMFIAMTSFLMAVGG